MAKVSHDSETPAHGQQVITACAFIYHEFDDGLKVFLPRRADTKKFLPGVYELPGGHIDYGEDIEAGVKREVMEEFGQEIVLGAPYAAFTYINEVKGSHSVEVVYFARFANGATEVVCNPEDHSGYKWFSEEDVRTQRAEIVPDGQVEYSHDDDPEYLNILRGFELLTATDNPYNS